MAERKVIHKGNIGNALHSVAPDHITTTADEVFDESRQEYQQDINDCVGKYIENPEFIKVELDDKGGIIRAIKADGTEYLGAGLEVHGDIDTDGFNITIIENPEFARVYLDGKGRILYGIQRDANFYFGAGVPKQIIDYIENRIESLSLDEYESIVLFLDGLELDEDFKTLRELLNEKVDKEEDKSLINKDYADGVEYVENPEFVSVKLTKDNKILGATRKDGTKFFGAGMIVKGTIDTDGAEIITVDNPEFIAVWTAQNKILFGLRKNADFVFGAGVPTQIIDFVNKKIATILGTEDETATIIDTIKELKIFVNGFVSGSNLLEYLNNTYGYYEINPEYVEVHLDANGKLIKAIKADGTVVYGAGYEIDGVKTSLVANIEFFRVYLDSADRIVFGIKKDGDMLFGCGIPSQIETYILSLIEPIKEVIGKYTTSSEFIEAILDSEGKVLAGRTPNGAAFEKIGFSSPKISTEKLDIDGHIVENIKDPEERNNIVADSEKKVISYRDKNGVLHELVGVESENIKVQNLEITGNLIGFDANPTDWSNYPELQIPEPRCARVNFTGIEDIPQAKFVDAHGYMEFWDMNGNYFKKEVIMNAQGSSSMGQPKKNIAVDICNNNGWDDDDTFKLRIGNWVPQDSFHLKAYNTDFFKGVGVIGYKVADLVAKTYNEQIDRTWKQALLPDYTFGDSTVNGDQINDKSIQAYNDARCMPDGFPCIVYLNGEFYGIYSWQIKKHRDNYHMNKSNAKNIHLDGVIDIASILNGVIQWSQFEIRNPKNLCYSTLHYDRSGKATFKYDADIPNGQDEIAGTDKNYDGDWVAGTYAIGKVVKKGSNYFINQVDNNDKEPVTQDARGNKNTAKDPDFKNKTKCGWINCTTSVKVKQYLINLSNVKSLIDAEATDAGKKAVFETYFDVNNFVDYLLVQMIVGDPDGFRKNWQWTTWDGVKWYLNNYDKDFSFGANASGKYTMPAFMTFITGDFTIGESRIFPMSCIRDYYRNELNTRYLNLRSNNVVSPNIIINLVKDWIDRIGEDNYKKESAKWNPPCDKDMILGEGWKLYAYTSYSDFYSVPVYQEGATYNIGDRCRVSSTEGLVVEATEETSSFPVVEYGHRDNFYRISNWIKNRFRYLDEYFNYSE